MTILLQISSIDDLEDGKDYVCSGKGEGFKKLDYSKLEINKIKKVASVRINNRNSILPRVVPPDCIRPRIVTLIRNGIKPRKVSLFLTIVSYYINQGYPLSGNPSKVKDLNIESRRNLNKI